MISYPHLGRSDVKKMTHFLEKVSGHKPPTRDDFGMFFLGLMDAGMPAKTLADVSLHLPKQASNDALKNIKLG